MRIQLVTPKATIPAGFDEAESHATLAYDKNLVTLKVGQIIPILDSNWTVTSISKSPYVATLAVANLQKV